MLTLLRLVVLNHRVVTRGKMTGFMAVEGPRVDGYWF
jgi:hypothetical protein